VCSIHPKHIYWTLVNVLKWEWVFLEHGKWSKLRPGDREKGTYLVPKISPSLDPYSLCGRSKSFYGIALVILRPQFRSGRGA
jgi:hypothetical protein